MVATFARRKRFCSLAALMVGFVLCEPDMRAQGAAESGTITWFMPLSRAAELVEQKYARAVTYEDPFREWAGEAETTAMGDVRLKQHSLTIPDGVLSGDVPTLLNAAILQKMIDAYHQQHPEGAKFRVEESAVGFHIIPTQVRNAEGAPVPVKSPLDFRIDVPAGNRTAFEHLAAITVAASKASGVPIEPFNSYFNAYFAANGYWLPRGELTGAERQYIVFAWGASGMTAREALVDLLSRSASTMSWILICRRGATTLPGNSCVLNMTEVQVGNPPRTLYFDRRPAARVLPGR